MSFVHGEMCCVLYLLYYTTHCFFWLVHTYSMHICMCLCVCVSSTVCVQMYWPGARLVGSTNKICIVCQCNAPLCALLYIHTSHVLARNSESIRVYVHVCDVYVQVQLVQMEVHISLLRKGCVRGGTSTLDLWW